MQTYTCGVNAVTSKAHVCRLLRTSYLFVKFLNPTCFCSTPCTIFWMTENHNLAWLFEFGLWTVVTWRWCSRVQLMPLQLQQQRRFCRVGTRLCPTLCPGEGTNLPWNTSTLCPWTFTLRGTLVLLLWCRPKTLQVWGVPWKKKHHQTTERESCRVDTITGN